MNDNVPGTKSGDTVLEPQVPDSVIQIAVETEINSLKNRDTPFLKFAFLMRLL